MSIRPSPSSHSVLPLLLPILVINPILARSDKMAKSENGKIGKMVKPLGVVKNVKTDRAESDTNGKMGKPTSAIKYLNLLKW